MRGQLSKIFLFVLIVIAFFSLSFYLFYLLEVNEETQKIKDESINLDNDFSTQMLLNSSIMAGNYLIKATSEEGIFAYEYDALQNEVNIDQYNILRHAGTIYSMLQLYNETKNEQLLLRCQRTIDFLLKYEKPFDNASCIVFNDRIKLGGNALAIIALAEYTKVTGNYSFLESMQNLSKYIKQQQKESGEFICKRIYSTNEISDFVSEYYPGEALLALCRLYFLDKNETWLDVAEKGAQYLILVRDKNIPTNSLIHDHWLLMALNELYRYRSNPLYLNQSIRIAESIMYSQNKETNEEFKDINLRGSFRAVRGTPTAVRSEGLIAAYHLTKDYGKTDMAKKILDSIKLAIEFQLQMQFTEEDVKDYPNPDQAIGGFRDYFTLFNIRIDYVQHNLCSILGLYQILDEIYTD